MPSISETNTVIQSAAKYFLDIGAGRNAPLPVADIESGLSVLVPLDAESLSGGEAHDLTNPDVVDHVLRLAWSGKIGLAA